LDNDEVTVDGATAETMKFIDGPKEVQGSEGGHCMFCGYKPQAMCVVGEEGGYVDL
jgi:hypothetical protein